jgi:flap endonuclease-1
LNRYFIKTCSNCIQSKKLDFLSGKTIVIDTSIYMYKFLGQDKLIENFYLLIYTLKHYNITSVFVFDGKPPEEKKEILSKRKESKNNAEIEFNALTLKLSQPHLSNNEIENINSQLSKLRKQFIRVKNEYVLSVKKLITICGSSYIESSGEADIVCAEMVINGQAWACLSDDMDLFVYGCNRVLRYISLINHTVIFYNFDEILTNLKIDFCNFKKILVLSGTDYNTENTNNVFSIFKLYKKFKKTNLNICFYEWLEKNSEIFCDKDKLLNIFDLFNTRQEHHKIPYYNENKNELKSFLNNYDFIFL